MLQNIKHRNEETIILAVQWHPGGTFFATGDYGHKEEGIESLLQFWNEDGVLIKSLKGSKAEYRNIRWNKDGTLLATASDGLRLWSEDGRGKIQGETNTYCGA
jgi:WD40 repeat protein